MDKKRGFAYELKKNKGLFLLMLPGVLYLFINNYVPMFGIVIAFKQIRTYGKNIFETYFNNPWVGFKNFEFFLKTQDAFIITRNTVLYNVVFIFLGLVLSVSCAIALNEVLNARLAKFYQSSMILPNFLSWIVISAIVYAFLTDKGFINSALLAPLGVEPKNFYFDQIYWPFILTAVQLWVNLGVGSVIYLASITGINGEYLEAATIDGATKWQQITKVTLPLLKPTIITMTIISLGGIFSANFGLFFNVPRESGILFSVTNVIDTYVFRALRTGGNTEMAAAAGFYQAIVGFVVVVISNGVIRKTSRENSLF